MNDILEKILAKKSPKEFAKEILEVRKIVGRDNEFDMSVEEAMGIHANVNIDIQYANIEINDIVPCVAYREMGETKDYSPSPIVKIVENTNIVETPIFSSSSKSNIFNKTASNNTPYSLAA